MSHLDRIKLLRASDSTEEFHREKVRADLTGKEISPPRRCPEAVLSQIEHGSLSPIRVLPQAEAQNFEQAFDNAA